MIKMGVAVRVTCWVRVVVFPKVFIADKETVKTLVVTDDLGTVILE